MAIIICLSDPEYVYPLLQIFTERLVMILKEINVIGLVKDILYLIIENLLLQLKHYLMNFSNIITNMTIKYNRNISVIGRWLCRLFISQTVIKMQKILK